VEAVKLITDTPCYNCEDRYAGCHSKCDNYKKFKENLEEDKRLKREAKKSIRQFYSPIRK